MPNWCTRRCRKSRPPAPNDLPSGWAGSRYRYVQAALGSSWSRTDLLLVHRRDAGGRPERAHAGPRRSTQRCHLDVRHDVPGTSKEVQEHLDGRGKVVFDGKITARDAQKTDAALTNHNLMSRGRGGHQAALIFADDVKCSHGTTVGESMRGVVLPAFAWSKDAASRMPVRPCAGRDRNFRVAGVRERALKLFDLSLPDRLRSG